MWPKSDNRKDPLALRPALTGPPSPHEFSPVGEGLHRPPGYLPRREHHKGAPLPSQGFPTVARPSRPYSRARRPRYKPP